MNRRCGCENGGDCTKTTVCAIESAVEDATESLQAEVERLREVIAEAEGEVLRRRMPWCTGCGAAFGAQCHCDND